MSPAGRGRALAGVELHTAVLSALDRAGDAINDASATPWHAVAAVDPNVPRSLCAANSRTVAEALSRQDTLLIGTTVNNASTALRGARRIIERHAPLTYGESFPPTCAHCNDPQWPCPDYRDAALVIPNLPAEVERAIR
ncbi:hypothetical protein [Micromonospora sp. RP3T]|uniref:hypothetical protein n=1 Tax=Micromonospora sp. RP3T TaxID=2135446 RepID=UPI003D716D51